MPARLFGYGKAAARWVAAGRPVRSDLRVREIFERCCRPCQHFDPKHKRCRLCGCRVAAGGPAYRNKLKMATDRCPAKPPKWP